MSTITLALTEPKFGRYIYLDPKTNRIHLMLPVVSGPEGIGLDNTCKAVYAVQEFFGQSRNANATSALTSLKNYQEALNFDIQCLPEDSEVKEQKKERLEQVTLYITLLEKIKDHSLFNCLSLSFPEYPSPLKQLMQRADSNLYSMVLCPTEQDAFLRTVNPVFSLPHDTNINGERISHPSSFYNALQAIYQTIEIKPKDKRAKLIEAVLASDAAKENNFNALQVELGKEVKKRFGETIDFTTIVKATIDEALGFEDNGTAQEYIEALLGYRAPNLFEKAEVSPFDAIEPGKSESDKQRVREELSLLTQFFLAEINIYCVAQQKTNRNCGAIVEGSEELSREVAARVKSALLNESSMEEALLDFINHHQEKFGLSSPLSEEEQEIIKQQFQLHYAQIKASPHFDEFMVVNTSKPGLFVSHQGSICTDLTAFIQAAIAEDASLQDWNHFHFQRLCEDFKNINGQLPHENKLYSEEENIKISVDIEKLSDEALRSLIERLPQDEKKRVYDLPEVKARLLSTNLLLHVARGEQDKAEHLLNSLNKEDKQALLLKQGAFTDYSERTFQCSAFEYAYWAKDTHMARMLIKFMDEATKAEMLQRCEAMEQQGLYYTLNGNEIHSPHFDFTPLKNAYAAYKAECTKLAWSGVAIQTSWLAIGKEQRLVPVHVANEYCHPNLSFSACASFNEPTLPRNLTFFNNVTENHELWFPLLSSNSGLGFDFSLSREGRGYVDGLGGAGIWPRNVRMDLAAIGRLDEARTGELIALREQLGQAPQPSNTWGCSLQ